MKSIFRIFLIVVVSLSLVNCASFSKKDFKDDFIPINTNNILSFNGKYTFSPVKKFDKKTTYSNLDTLKKYINSYHSITNENLKPENTDSIFKGLTQYHIELNVVNNNDLSIELFKNNYSIKKQKIKAGLKKTVCFIWIINILNATGFPIFSADATTTKDELLFLKTII